MSYSTAESFIGRNFSRMPLPVRVIAYLAMLFLFIYQSLLPKFINGDVRLRVGGECSPHCIATVSLTIDGNTVFAHTDSNGCWSIPLTTQIPHNISLKFWHGERDERYTEIPLNGLRILMREHFVVNFNPDSTPKYQLADFEESDDLLRVVGNFLLSIHSKLAIVSTVFAQDNIERETFRVISETLCINITSIRRTSHLIKTFHLDERRQIKLKRNLEQKFNINITAREWKNNLFVEDLITVIKQKLNQ